EPLEHRCLPTVGALDPLFGSSGLLVAPVGPGPSRANAVAILTEGNDSTADPFLLAGQASDPSGNHFPVARFTATGAPAASATPCGSGPVLMSFGTPDEGALALVVQPDGKIVVGGFAGIPGQHDFALVRLNADGSLDNSFGNGGEVTLDLGGDDVLQA